jgi:serine protease inhibitor
VSHIAFTSVNEEGWKPPQPQTSKRVRPRGAPISGLKPPEVRIDRPFIFAILDTQTGTVLFLGRVMDLSA